MDDDDLLLEDFEEEPEVFEDEEDELDAGEDDDADEEDGEFADLDAALASESPEELKCRGARRGTSNGMPSQEGPTDAGGSGSARRD